MRKCQDLKQKLTEAMTLFQRKTIEKRLKDEEQAASKDSVARLAVVKERLERRNEMRRARDFEGADALRDELQRSRTDAARVLRRAVQEGQRREAELKAELERQVDAKVSEAGTAWRQAVEEEQHIRRRKLKMPETNWRRNMAMVARPSQLWML